MKTTRKTPRIGLIIMWIWPLITLLIVGRSLAHGNGLWYVCNSTWVLFVGVMQSWLMFTTKKWKQNRLKWYIVVVCVLTIASLLLLPFGLAKWDVYHVLDDQYNPTQIFRMNPNFYYDENIWLSLALHFLAPIAMVSVHLGLSNDTGVPSFSGDYSAGHTSGSGPWGEKTWLDDVWKGGQVSDDFIGHRGEFDLNDEARRVSEDMQQFHYNHPNADLSDHYYWEDVLDADTDGYLEEN